MEKRKGLAVIVLHINEECEDWELDNVHESIEQHFDGGYIKEFNVYPETVWPDRNRVSKAGQKWQRWGQ